MTPIGLHADTVLPHRHPPHPRRATTPLDLDAQACTRAGDILASLPA